MIVEPEQRVADFAKAGADIISVHAEQSSTIHLHRLVYQVIINEGRVNISAQNPCRHKATILRLRLQIKDLGCKAGVVLNPATSLDTIEYVLPDVDLVLIMSVNPGFGGQKFIESQVGRW